MLIIGHKKQREILKRSFELERVPHALLFQGPKRLGKKTIALEFIKLINCQGKDFSSIPCHKCFSCKEIERGIHPDFVLIKPVKKEIHISQIRDLSMKFSLRPSLNSFKSAIIDNAHLMTAEAQSCFLKTLEEPKGKTIFILVTEHPERLLPTILSRVQQIKFYPVKREEIENYLISQKFTKSEAQKLSIDSFGKPGLVKEFILSPVKLEKQEQKIKELIEISNSDLTFRFQYIKDNLLKEDNLKEILEIWLIYFRKKLLEVVKKEKIISDNHNLFKLKSILQLIQNTIFYISNTNISPRLALEVLLLEL